MKTVRISVTQKDIACGKPKSARKCPIAKAVRRKLGIRSVEVDGLTARLNGGPYINLPKRADRFVNRFDWYGRESVKPFSFNVKLNKRVIGYLNS